MPGKVLRPLCGLPLIDHVISKARSVQGLCDVVVATSRCPSDDLLVEHCCKQGVAVFRGALDNVARRVLDCAEHHAWDYYVRLNADSPLLDSTLIDEGIRRAVDGDFELVTNLFPRSFPQGISLEVIQTAAYRKAYSLMASREDFEHVTHFFYTHMDHFRFENIRASLGDCRDMCLTVDLEEDFERLALLARVLDFTRQNTAQDIIAAYKRVFSEPAEAYPADQSA